MMLDGMHMCDVCSIVCISMYTFSFMRIFSDKTFMKQNTLDVINVGCNALYLLYINRSIATKVDSTYYGLLTNST